MKSFRLLAAVGVVLRLFGVFALLLVMNSPHIGMANTISSGHHMAMTEGHSTAGMDQIPMDHQTKSSVLCAIICLGCNAAHAPMAPERGGQTSSTAWVIPNVLIAPLSGPILVLRPPIPFLSA